jgi:hypothetical protein
MRRMLSCLRRRGPGGRGCARIASDDPETMRNCLDRELVTGLGRAGRRQDTPSPACSIPHRQRRTSTYCSRRSTMHPESRATTTHTRQRRSRGRHRLCRSQRRQRHPGRRQAPLRRSSLRLGGETWSLPVHRDSPLARRRRLPSRERRAGHRDPWGEISRGSSIRHGEPPRTSSSKRVTSRPPRPRVSDGPARPCRPRCRARSKVNE